MRILVFLRVRALDRGLEHVLRHALERGHEVHLTYEFKHFADANGAAFAALAQNPRLTHEHVPRRADLLARPAAQLRQGLDFMHFLRPEYLDRPKLTKRARARAPAVLRTLGELSSAHGFRTLRSVEVLLGRVEAAIPASDSVRSRIRGLRPHLVLTYGTVGLAEDEHVRAARQFGATSAFLVDSLDRLCVRGVPRRVPTRTIVWNEPQRREAVELFGLPPGRVVATGAHAFDEWFGMSPSTTPEAFAAKVGLKPGPFVLYVGASRNTLRDVSFIEQLLHQIRSSENPAIRDLGVLIHPRGQRAAWSAANLNEPGRTVVAPSQDEASTDGVLCEEEVDAIHHCRAVVGLDPLVLAKALIVGRPVLAVRDDPSWNQELRLPFFHPPDRAAMGAPVVDGFERQLVQLARAVAEPDAHAGAAQTFLRGCIRPHGLGEAVVPRVVDTLEVAAREPISSTNPGIAHALMRAVMVAAHVGGWPRLLKRRVRWVRLLKRRVRLGVTPGPAPPGVCAGTHRASHDPATLGPCVSE